MEKRWLGEFGNKIMAHAVSHHTVWAQKTQQWMGSAHIPLWPWAFLLLWCVELFWIISWRCLVCFTKKKKWKCVTNIRLQLILVCPWTIGVWDLINPCSIVAPTLYWPVSTTMLQEHRTPPSCFQANRVSEYDMYSTAAVSLQWPQIVAMLWDTADVTASALVCSPWVSLALLPGWQPLVSFPFTLDIRHTVCHTQIHEDVCVCLLFSILTDIVPVCLHGGPAVNI